MLKIWQRLNKKRLFIIFILIFLEATLFLILPSLAADILNVSSLEGNQAKVNQIGLFMLVANTITIFLAIMSTRMSAQESQGLGNQLRKDIFRKTMAFSRKDIAHFGTSTLMTRTTNDVMQIQIVTMLFIRLVSMFPIMLTVSTVLAYQREPQLAWVFAITLPLIIVALLFIFKVASPFFKSIQFKTDQLNKVFREGLTGIRVIRAFNTSQYEEAKFDQVNQDYRDTAISAYTCLALMLPLMFIIIGISNVLIFTNGAQLISVAEMEPGSLIAFVQYSVQVLMSVIQIAMLLFFLPRAEVAAQRISEILEYSISIRDPDQPISLKNRPLSLEFEEVSFGYEGAEKQTLSQINFEAHPGETVAIIGGTGSGKTTIASLISRLLDVTSGRVLVNGLDIREVSQQELRQKIGFAPQKALLFSGTIRSNLQFSNPNATDEEIWRALEIAQADFVKDLPQGLDARVEQGGNNFSGGQKQRLSIARAIVRQPEIYIFDDSFSALDFKTDAKLRQALKEVTKDAITVIIAQRINTVINADRILVLDNGMIVGQGKHEELKNSNSVYRDIMESQMKGEER